MADQKGIESGFRLFCVNSVSVIDRYLQRPERTNNHIFHSPPKYFAGLRRKKQLSLLLKSPSQEQPRPLENDRNFDIPGKGDSEAFDLRKVVAST
jgi:hypothetical protein